MNPNSTITFDNSGQGPVKVPGFAGVPYFFQLQRRNRFSHGFNDHRDERLDASSFWPGKKPDIWQDCPLITSRELVMLSVMNDITEQPDWHINVFNDKVLAEWRTSVPELISDKAWTWCIAELRDKAAVFKETGQIVVLNSWSSVFKSEALVPTSLQAELRENIQPLISNLKCAENEAEQQVLDLVNPSMFPLVYGKTRVLTSGQVELDKCIEAYGNGEIAPIQPDRLIDLAKTTRVPAGLDPERVREYPFANSEEPEIYRWSKNFQWLPCEVQFVDKFAGDTTGNSTVQITSYINDIHPIRHRPLYHSLEKLISLVIEPWNEILVKGIRGRFPLRIKTYGVERAYSVPEWARGLEETDDKSSPKYQESLSKVKDWLAIPDPVQKTEWKEWEQIPTDWEEKLSLKEIFWRKFRRLRDVYGHPEPGISFTYEDWKAGKTSNAITEPRTEEPDHHYYTIRLQEAFRKQGLQVVVKISSIELTPEKPVYSENWHPEGFLNDHVVATAVYYYDVENIAEDASISFQQEIDANPSVYDWKEPDEGNFAEVFGLKTSYSLNDYVSDYLSVSCQEGIKKMGSVKTKQGRLMVWPNNLHNRGQVELKDKARPGHQRFITLMLVDPHYRVCSTRNVPVQRQDWLAEEGKNPDLQAVKSGIDMEEARKLYHQWIEEKKRADSAVQWGVDWFDFSIPEFDVWISEYGYLEGQGHRYY